MTDVYIFAKNTQSTLVSYPHDQTHEFFQYAISKSKNNAQIVLVRKDNLLHYCYVRKIWNKKVFGLCLRLDRVYSDIENLFRAFDTAFTNLVEAGVILQMDEKSNIKLCVSNFATETVAIKEMSDVIIHALGNIQKNTIPLPPADYSISINDCIELSLEDTTNVQIINAIKKYCNVYIVKTHAEIARVTEIANLIKDKNKEIKQLQDTLTLQEHNISDLKKQKNKFKWVLLLLSIIFIGAIIFFNVMQSKNDSIFKLQQENAQLEKHVGSLQKDSVNLESQLNFAIKEKRKVEKVLSDSIVVIKDLRSKSTQLTYDYQQLERRYEDSQIKLENSKNEVIKYRNQYSALQFGITNIEISNRYSGGKIDVPYGERIKASQSMYLQTRFECCGSDKNQKIQFELKLFYPNGGLIYSSEENRKNGYTYKEEFIIKKGKNTYEFPNRIGGANRGNYSPGEYRCEIWANDIKLGEKHFTLY